MTSAAQLASNRRNAQAATGPVTTAGKEKSSRNSLKHGLTSKQIVLAHEDPAKFEQLHADLAAEHCPAGPTQEMLVFELAVSWLRLCRARRVEAEYMGVSLARGSSDQSLAREIAGPGPSAIERIQRYVTSAERAWCRALSQLQQTQSIRRKHEKEQSAPPPETGFVSQNRVMAAAASIRWRDPDESDLDSTPRDVVFRPPYPNSATSE